MLNDRPKVSNDVTSTGCIRRRGTGAAHAVHSSFVIRHSSFTKRSAFTLIELIVSVGILGILLVVAGGVFTLTLKSSGQANALIEVSEQIRALEETLAADLRNVQPGRSIMIIQPNVIHSMWTTDELSIARESGVDEVHAISAKRDPERERFNAAEGRLERELPRSDIIAFFTDRPATSVRDPEIVGQSQFVIYGHAQIGELARDGSWQVSPSDANVGYPYDEFPFTSPQFRMRDRGLRFSAATGGALVGTYSINPADVDDEDLVPAGHSVFPVAAENWHLARRAVVIADRNLSPSDTPPHYPAATLNDSAAGLTQVGISSVQDDDPSYSALSAYFNLRDGRRDYIVNGSAGFDYELDVVRRVPNPEFDAPMLTAGAPLPDAVINWIARTQLAFSPRANQSERLGAYFMPNCANFKVEWALDLSDLDLSRCDPELVPWQGEIIWVDPGDFAKTVVQLNDAARAYVAAYPPDSLPCSACLSTLDCDACAATASSACACVCRMVKVLDRIAPLRPNVNPNVLNPNECILAHNPSRFVDPGQTGNANPVVRSTHVFYATDPAPSCMGKYPPDMQPPTIPDSLFPKAVRITVDIYDAGRRLERPIRHVMVLPVGQN